MRKRKHPRPNQRKNAHYNPRRRRKVFMNFAIVVVAAMAVSFVLASFTRRASAPTDFAQAKTPARQPASATLPASHK